MALLKRLSLVLLALPLVGAGSCDSDSPTAAGSTDPSADAASVTLPANVTLAVGETVVVDSVGVEVTFSSVTEDSRCPIDVTCVWAGRAVVALAIGAASGASTIELEVGQWRQVSGLRLAATALDPPQREGQEIRPEDYRLELSITRAGG